MKRLLSGSKLFYGYFILSALWFIYFFNVGMILYGTTALNASMVAARGFDAAVIGYAVSICTLMQGLTGPIVGMMVDRHGIKMPFIFGSIILVIGSITIVFFTLSEIIFMVTYGFLIGAGMGLAGIITTQSSVNIWFEQKKPLAIAIVSSAGGISGFVTPMFLDYITGLGSWTYGWMFIAAACCCSLLLSIVVLINSPAQINEIPDGKLYHSKHPVAELRSGAASDTCKLTVKELFSHSPIYHIVFNTVSRNILYYACIGQIVFMLINNGMIRSRAVIIISIMSVVSLAGRFLFGFLCGKRIKITAGLAFANFSMGIGLLLIVFFVKSIVAVYLGGGFIGLGLGAGYIATPLFYSDFLGNINFPRVIGCVSPINYTSSALGPLLAGLVATITGSYANVFIAMSFLCISGGLSILFSRPLDFKKLKQFS